jgi:16S rRNA (uracil1498-N3)-methyltransferase
MDWLVEKATELGVSSIQPLMAERSVLKLSAERSGKKLNHWRGVAMAACEQCGRNRVPVIHEAAALGHWLKSAAGSSHRRILLSLRADSQPLARSAAADKDTSSFLFLSGPEGGFSLAEEEAAMAASFVPVTLGPRVLRAETAPLACLALLGLQQA